MKLHFTNDWLRRTTAADPDVDIEAGPAIDGNVGHVSLAYADNASPAESRARVQLRIGLGVLVRKLRTRDGLSIAELARRADVAEDELRQVEHDPHYTARPRLIHQLSEYFSVSLVMLSQMAGATHDFDRFLYNEAVKYAAHSDDVGTLSSEERAILDAFVAMLNTRAKG
jgi:transcriptional regulator with XRE-family HTH domain